MILVETHTEGKAEELANQRIGHTTTHSIAAILAIATVGVIGLDAVDSLLNEYSRILWLPQPERTKVVSEQCSTDLHSTRWSLDRSLRLGLALQFACSTHPPGSACVVASNEGVLLNDLFGSSTIQQNHRSQSMVHTESTLTQSTATQSVALFGPFGIFIIPLNIVRRSL